MDLEWFVAQVQAALRDVDAATWLTEDITRYVGYALRDYDVVAPRRLYEVIAAVAGEREYPLSAPSFAGLMEVYDVHYPYDAVNPRWPPFRPAWQVIDGNVLVLELSTAPSVGESIRVDFTSPHTIMGLDGAESTTLPARDWPVVVYGATAYGAEEIAQGVIGTVTVSNWTPRHYEAWAARRRAAFADMMVAVRRRAILAVDARTAWTPRI